MDKSYVFTDKTDLSFLEPLLSNGARSLGRYGCVFDSPALGVYDRQLYVRSVVRSVSKLLTQGNRNELGSASVESDSLTTRVFNDDFCTTRHVSSIP